jgi:hypothetical protein
MPSDDPKLCEEILSLKTKINSLEADVSEMKAGISELLHAWEQGVGVAKFVKVMVMLIAPIIAVVVFVKDHVRLM